MLQHVHVHAMKAECYLLKGLSKIARYTFPVGWFGNSGNITVVALTGCTVDIINEKDGLRWRGIYEYISSFVTTLRVLPHYH
jgi:hypothetical protein